MSSIATLPLATFAAGMISFLSPCVLPLVPGYLSIISGVSAGDLHAPDAPKRLRTLKHAVSFVLGFSVVFIGFGAAAGLLGAILGKYIGALETGFGVLVILFGLHMTGVLPVSLLSREARLHGLMNGGDLVGSFVTGFAFAFGWTPCVGPVLGTVLALAATQSTVPLATSLLALYSLGLAIPFLLTALSVDRFVALYRELKAPLAYLNIASGVLLVVTGALLMTHQINTLSTWMNNIPLFRRLAEYFL